jgi:hypothetical protein
VALLRYQQLSSQDQGHDDDLQTCSAVMPRLEVGPTFLPQITTVLHLTCPRNDIEVLKAQYL